MDSSWSSLYDRAQPLQHILHHTIATDSKKRESGLGFHACVGVELSVQDGPSAVRPPHPYIFLRDSQSSAVALVLIEARLDSPVGQE